MQVAKTKAKLICVFVFEYVKRWFSHDVAHLLTHFICILKFASVQKFYR